MKKYIIKALSVLSGLIISLWVFLWAFKASYDSFPAFQSMIDAVGSYLMS